MDEERRKWLLGRKKYIGASDVPILCGYSSRRTPMQLYHDKISSDIIDEEMSEEALWGIEHEPTIARQYSKRTGFNVRRRKKPIIHRDYPFLGVNIDRWANNMQHYVEIKTGHFLMTKEWGERKTDQIPLGYLCQVGYGCEIVSSVYPHINRVDIPVLLGGSDYRVYTYYHNKVFAAKLIKIAINFWNNHVLKRIPPPPVNNADMSLLYPRSEDIAIEANDDVYEHARRLIAIKDNETELTKESDLLKMQIKMYMKDHDTLLDKHGTRLITWRTNTKGNRTFLIK